MRFSRTVAGNFCEACRRRLFWETTAITAVAGWWGIISFFVTPVFIISNVIEVLSSAPGEGARVPATSPPSTAPGAAGSGRGQAPGGSASGLAIASVVLGALAMVSCGLGIPLALLGLVFGVIVIVRARRSGAPAGGTALVGVGLSTAALIIGGFVTYVALTGSRTTPSTLSPADRAFRDADAEIMAYRGRASHGSSAAARQMAERMSRAMRAMVLLATSGKAPRDGLSLSQGHCLTYVETREGQACFLVHVPSLRRYSDEAKRAMAQLAWRVAADIAADAYGRKDIRVAVGLRGVLLYGAVASGAATEKQPAYIKVGADALPDHLRDFFAGPPATSLAATSTPGTPGPGATPSATPSPTPDAVVERISLYIEMEAEGRPRAMSFD